MNEKKVTKIQRIEQCLICNWNRFYIEGRFYRSRCTNPEAKCKNGSYRIVNKKQLVKGQFPYFCPLEDYTFPAGYGDYPEGGKT